MANKLLQYFEAWSTKHSERKTTISKKVGSIFILILLVGVGHIVVVQMMLQEIHGVAETINVAGKLRMLSQKIAFESMKVLADTGRGPDKVRAAINDFDTALNALERGGHPFDLEINPISQQHRPQLDVMRANWRTYRSHVETSLASKSSQPDWPKASNQITEDSARLLLSAETLVGALTRESDQTQQSALAKMLALLALDACVLTAMFFDVRKQIVYPLRMLVRHSAALMHGDYQQTIHYQSNDELGRLADTFNLMTRHIGSLISHAEKDRQIIQRAESMFRGLAENSIVGVYIIQDNVFRFANPKMTEMFLYEPQELMASFSVFKLIAEKDRHVAEANIERRLKGQLNEVNVELRALRKDGTTFDVEVFGSKMELDGKIAIIGIMLDITERKHIDRALRIANASNQALVRATEESVLLAEICRVVQQLGGYPFVWVGYAEESAAKQVLPVAAVGNGDDIFDALIHGETWNIAEDGQRATGLAIQSGRATVAQDLQSNTPYLAWHKFVAQYGVVSVLALPLRMEEKSIGAITIYSRDAAAFTSAEVRIMEELAENLAYGITALRIDTARRFYAQQLEHNANHDALTGLGNRHLLSDRLKQAMASARRSGQMVAVLLLDLDHFKIVNDSLGHAAGDLLLQTVADRLLSSVRQVDTVVRLGGDEFVIVMPEVISDDKVSIVARKILEVLSQSFSISGNEAHIGTSIGISLYPQDGKSEADLLKNVDLAMYRAKQNGRGNFHFYTEEINARNVEKSALQHQLHFALSRGELFLQYQPIIDTVTRKFVGVEALIRWQHPEQGIILPERFIPLAEETGLIIPIGTWVIQTACRQNKAWQNAGLPPVSVSVNLSAWQFHRRDLVGLIKQVLHDTDLTPRYLELELAESILIQEASEAVPTLLGLKALGVRLSLDDFGTGHSSLNYLRHYPFDNLKIDRVFVKGIVTNPHDRAIVHAVIALAHSLNLKVIAEGVELKAELDFLQSHDCDEIQGYYFSKPLPADELGHLLGEYAF